MTDDPAVIAAITPLYFEAGSGLGDCQRFEYGLGLLLLYLAKLGVEGLDEDRMRAILDGDEKRTAGQLVQLLESKVQVALEFKQALADGLQSRNRLVHRFLVENGARVVNAAERPKVVAELRGLRFRVQAAEHLLRPIVGQLAKQTDGIDLQQMQAQALRGFFGGGEADETGPTPSRQEK
jgi:hypothetical protein